MAQSKKDHQLSRKLEDSMVDIQNQAEQTYDTILNKLNIERDELERILRHEYRNARRYIRAHPERGVGIAFFSGILLGMLLSGGKKD